MKEEFEKKKGFEKEINLPQRSMNKASMSRPERFVLPVGSLGEATAGLLWQSPSYVELVVQTS